MNVIVLYGVVLAIRLQNVYRYCYLLIKSRVYRVNDFQMDDNVR